MPRPAPEWHWRMRVSSPAMRYKVRERLFSIKDDFWVTDQDGNRVFFVDAKVLSLRHKLDLQDASGRTLAEIKQKLVTFTDAMEVERDGSVVATVHKVVLSPLHHRAVIDLADGRHLEAVGNIVDKDFEIRDGGPVVGRVSRARIHHEEEEQRDRDR